MGLGAGEGALGPGGGNTDRGSLLSQSRVRCAVSAGLLTRAGSAAVRQCGTLGGFKGPAPRRRPPSLGHPWGRARAARAGCGAGRDGTARGQSRKAQGRGRGRGRPRGRGCAGEPRHPGAQVLRRRPALRAGRAAVKGDGGGGTAAPALLPRRPSVRWKRQGWAPQRAGAGGSRGAWPGGGALPGAGARARAVRRRGARAGPRGADGTAPGAPVR
jgi:hypothetical protein